MDLYTKIPFISLPEKRREELWDDGVHFTFEGYDLMGKYVAEALIEIVNAELAENPELYDSDEEVDDAGHERLELKNRVVDKAHSRAERSRRRQDL